MGDNLKIRKLKKDLADVLNSSMLPIEVKRIIMADLLNDVTNLADNEVQKEINELESEEKESESNGISSDN